MAIAGTSHHFYPTHSVGLALNLLLSLGSASKYTQAQQQVGGGAKVGECLNCSHTYWNNFQYCYSIKHLHSRHLRIKDLPHLRITLFRKVRLGGDYQLQRYIRNTYVSFIITLVLYYKIKFATLYNLHFTKTHRFGK